MTASTTLLRRLSRSSKAASIGLPSARAPSIAASNARPRSSSSTLRERVRHDATTWPAVSGMLRRRSARMTASGSVDGASTAVGIDTATRVRPRTSGSYASAIGCTRVGRPRLMSAARPLRSGPISPHGDGRPSGNTRTIPPERSRSTRARNSPAARPARRLQNSESADPPSFGDTGDQRTSAYSARSTSLPTSGRRSPAPAARA